MPGCIVSATTASFRSVEKRRLRATPVITSTLENVSDIGTCLGLSLGPPASAGVRSKRGALHRVILVTQDTDCIPAMSHARRGGLQVVLIRFPNSTIAPELLEHTDIERLVAWPP